MNKFDILNCEAKRLTYNQWLDMGGCGISRSLCAYVSAPPVAWGEMKLSDLLQDCIAVDRCLARYAIGKGWGK